MKVFLNNNSYFDVEVYPKVGDSNQLTVGEIACQLFTSFSLYLQSGKFEHPIKSE
jgi:hypothetical protein